MLCRILPGENARNHHLKIDRKRKQIIDLSSTCQQDCQQETIENTVDTLMDTEIVPEGMQTATSKSMVIPFTADTCCVLCRTSSRDNLTNCIPKRLKTEQKKKLDPNRRYLCCKNCREKSCDLCVQKLFMFFQKEKMLVDDDPWMIVAESFLGCSDIMFSIDGSISHCCKYWTNSEAKSLRKRR